MRTLIAISVASLSLAVMASPRAATITTSLSDWQSKVGGAYSTTTDFGYSDGTSTNSVNIAGGQTLGITDGGTVFGSPAFGGWNHTNLTGQVVEVDFLDETLTFSPSITALGFIVEPSAAAQASILVTLSDGTQQTINADFTAPGSTQFIGFYNGGVDSISLSFDGLGDSGEFAFADVVDSTVPEPMSMALLLSGVTALGLIRRRGTSGTQR